MRLSRYRGQRVGQDAKALGGVLLAGPNDRVRVGNDADGRAVPRKDKRDHEDLGARAVKPVKMTLERTMEDHVAGANAVPAGVAGFVISARENDRGKRLAMTVARQEFARIVPHPAGSGAAEAPM